MSQAHDVSDHEFVFCSTSSRDMYLFDCNTETVTSLGPRTPFDYVNDFETTDMSLDEFGVDKYGALWYITAGWKMDKPTDEFYRAPNPRLLIYWDFKNGKKPECLGILSSQDISFNAASCMCIDQKNDRLYAIGAATRVDGKTPEIMPEGGAQTICCIDLAELRPKMHEKGPVWDQPMKVTCLLYTSGNRRGELSSQ